MNQIPNIEEKNTREVKAVSKELLSLAIQFECSAYEASKENVKSERDKKREIACDEFIADAELLLHQQLQKAREDWLRSEIEKLEGMKQPITIDDRVESAFASIEWDRYNEALTTIITRYKEELKELESKI